MQVNKDLFQQVSSSFFLTVINTWMLNKVDTAELVVCIEFHFDFLLDWWVFNTAV